MTFPVPTATESLAARAASVLQCDLSPAIVHRAKQSILDALALGILGMREPPTRILCDALLEFGGAPQCSTFGLPQRMPAMHAALVNGTAIHAIDYDDTYGPGLAHLTSAVLPAALAVAEWKSSSGSALLRAYVAGYDAAALIALASDAAATAERGFHPTGCFGTFGAAVAAGCLMGLDAAGLRRAIGLAATQAAGLMSNVGTMAKPLHAGKAASNGVLAALLATKDFTSGNDPVGNDSGIVSYSGTLNLEAILNPEQIGTALLQTTLKPYPSCWLTHGAIDAAMKLHLRDEPQNAISSICVAVSPYAAQVCDRPSPSSPLDAKFSIQHVIALALTNGRIEIADFDADVDLPLGALRALVTIDTDPSLRDNQARLRVCRNRSGCQEIAVETVSGSPGRALTDDQLRAKVSSVLESCGLKRLAEPLRACVDKLPSSRSIFELMSICRDGGTGLQVE